MTLYYFIEGENIVKVDTEFHEEYAEDIQNGNCFEVDFDIDLLINPLDYKHRNGVLIHEPLII